MQHCPDRRKCTEVEKTAMQMSTYIHTFFRYHAELRFSRCKCAIGLCQADAIVATDGNCDKIDMLMTFWQHLRIRALLLASACATTGPVHPTSLSTFHSPLAACLGTAHMARLQFRRCRCLQEGALLAASLQSASMQLFKQQIPDAECDTPHIWQIRCIPAPAHAAQASRMYQLPVLPSRSKHCSCSSSAPMRRQGLCNSQQHQHTCQLSRCGRCSCHSAR